MLLFVVVYLFRLITNRSFCLLGRKKSSIPAFFSSVAELVGDNIPYGAVNLRRNLRRKKKRYLPYGESLTYGATTKIKVKKLLTYREKIPAQKTPYVKDAVG